MMTLLLRPRRHGVPPCFCSFRSALVAAGRSWVFSRQFRVPEASPESSSVGLFSSFLLACWGQGPEGGGITAWGCVPVPLSPAAPRGRGTPIMSITQCFLGLVPLWAPSCGTGGLFPAASGTWRKRLTGHAPASPLHTTRGQLRGRSGGEAASSAPWPLAAALTFPRVWSSCEGAKGVE